MNAAVRSAAAGNLKPEDDQKTHINKAFFSRFCVPLEGSADTEPCPSLGLIAGNYSFWPPPQFVRLDDIPERSPAFAFANRDEQIIPA